MNVPFRDGGLRKCHFEVTLSIYESNLLLIVHAFFSGLSKWILF
jgi:hypothetical protein